MASFREKLSKVFWSRLSFGGLLIGVPFFWLSLTPSLLPRSWFFQGLLSAITFLIGYGFGNLSSSIYRRLGGPEPKFEQAQRFKMIFLVVAGIMSLLFIFQAQEWQQEIRRLVSMDDNTGLYPVLTVVAFMFFLYLILIIARGLRYLTRWVQRTLDKILPRMAAYVIGAALIITLVILTFTGVLIPGIFEAVNQTYSISDGTTTEGTEQPQSPFRSGSPSSLVPWDTLGQKGRNFTGLGPSVEQISDFNGSQAKMPIRAYVGLKSADELNDRVDLALAELDRVNAWSREVLVVATTTGTGWLDPKGVDTIEYLWNGDTAIIGMQYSYLPSTISIFADQGKSKETASALYNEIYIRWSQLPENNRPELVLYGLSLGSYGSEASFDGITDITNQVDGVLWAGPTFLNELWRPITDARDEGSPQWQPIVQSGETVRFTAKDNALFKDGTNAVWEYPRVVYLQHGTDPLAFFSLDSFVSEPDWMNEERAPDVSESLNWIPIVTGWQLLFDLPFASGVPHGHGHEYALGSYIDAWANITEPSGWTEDNSRALDDLLENSNTY